MIAGTRVEVRRTEGGPLSSEEQEEQERLASLHPGLAGVFGPDDSPGCAVAELDALIEQGRTFGTIYADPPWQYRNQATRAAASKHYPTMPLDEIAALPISDLAAENAHLHLWTTNAFLPSAFGIIEAWGFTYKSCLVWVKPQMGLGNYWRVSTEILLLGVRGWCPFGGRPQRSWVEHPRTGHSRKPEVVREIIEQVSPRPRLELFGRITALGWTVWGNEVEKSLYDGSHKDEHRA